ncbi:MAG: NifB/NifX family molybdenum-iron cluster-binding protein [Ignavibacteriaceae bacterium]|jgi:predicted Fe-Mo cluster-binding NifX family protein|nr:NifB/NifX family molybdenum-iron cluster-binding protein [Ignavibacteriaceae bacterium]
MKIAVVTDNELNVAGHAGRCRVFLVFETENKKIINKEVRINTFTHHRQHGHNQHEHHHGEGHNHSHNALIDGLKDCEVLIFNHGGRRLVDDLKTNNIKPILTDEELAEDAVLKYLDGTLVINEDNVCQGHHH